jgi:DNA sulfur modification protein DndD
MDVKLISWRYKNIRGGLSGLEIKLGNPPTRWTLIQMPNGMGKTTTMHLFRAAFSGEPLDAEIVRGFRPADDVKSGEFELVVTVAGQIYRIALVLNFETGTCAYHTARADVQSGGKQIGHVLPKELKSLLTPEFTKLFIFDGELARQIRDLKRERAADAIRTLYRLDRLAEMRSQIDRLIAEEQLRSSETTKAQTSQGLKALRTRVEKAKGKLSELKRQHRNLESCLSEGRARIIEIDKAIREHMQQDKDFRSQVNELELKRNAVEKELVDLSKSTLSELRNPAAIDPRVTEQLADLGHKMQRLKLPKTLSIEFFHELAQQPVCVCGRAIGSSEREAILARASEYLSEDQIGVVNAIKSAVRQYEEGDTTFAERAAALKKLIEERQRLNGDWDRLQAERVAAGDLELDRLKSDKQQLEADNGEHEEALEALTCTDASLQKGHGVDWESNLPLCKGEVKEREKALAEATGTVSFLKKATVTKELIEKIENRALDLIKDRLRTATNEKLKKLIPSEAIKVARIGGALELESDRLGSKQQVSEGQSLAIAYAFLTSLFEQAPYRLPFIVDSPAGSLDLQVRRDVAELIPGLFEQVVMFVISSEREGFADPFYGRKGVRFCTIWRNNSQATQVNDEVEFFKQFHSDER